MGIIPSATDFPASVDETSVSTGTPAYARFISDVQAAIATLAGHPYESGSVMFGVAGSKRQLASGQPDIVIPIRRSIASRDLLVEFVAEGQANAEVVFTVTHGSISKEVSIVGTGTVSHQSVQWSEPVILTGIGDGTLSTHDRTNTQPTNDLVLSYSSGTGSAWIYAVAWTELHNDRIEV